MSSSLPRRNDDDNGLSSQQQQQQQQQAPPHIRDWGNEDAAAAAGISSTVGGGGGATRLSASSSTATAGNENDGSPSPAAQGPTGPRARRPEAREDAGLLGRPLVLLRGLQQQEQDSIVQPTVPARPRPGPEQPLPVAALSPEKEGDCPRRTSDDGATTTTTTTTTTSQLRRPEAQVTGVPSFGMRSSLAPPLREISSGDVAKPSPAAVVGAGVAAPLPPQEQPRPRTTSVSSMLKQESLSLSPSSLLSTSIPEQSLLHSPESSEAPLRLHSALRPLSRRRLIQQQQQQSSSHSAAASTSSSSTLLHPGDASVFQGEKTMRLSVVRTSASATATTPQELSKDSKAISFAPRKILDIENGTSMVVTQQEFLDDVRFQRLDSSGALMMEQAAPLSRPDYYIQSVTSLEDKLRRGDVRDFRVNSETGVLGGMWRGALWRLMVASRDSVNALQLSRGLQLFLPFLTSYESYVLAQVIQALDYVERRGDLQYTLKVAFRNRNVSRILVQTIGPRYDFVWHWSTQVTHNRLFDSWGQFPIVGITGFPATENFPSTRNHALASIFRNVLGQGNWLTRVLTGREGLVTDDPQATSQNLAAESNGFELANRNQYSTYVGRRKTNEFRLAHRLPTDESIVRTFVAQPMPTMVNNGVVHVLRQLAKHWHNMLYQPSGNFAHQRMEQLNPFETLRFHMPMILVTLSSLRGRNRWDSGELGPFIKRLQALKPSATADSARYLISELRETIGLNACGGVAQIMDPLFSLLDAMNKSCLMLEEEAKEVYDVASSVEIGIRLGHDLITQVNWRIPSDSQLKRAILRHIRGESTGGVSESSIRVAMALITPRDKRTLVELVKTGLGASRPAQLLLGRAKTLLQRELRRETLNQKIRALSKGDHVTDLKHGEWYWVEFDNESPGVFVYDNKITGKNLHRFVHVDSKLEKYAPLSSVKSYAYVPVAEAISRAQRAFMNIELDHGKKFSYDAFMEFTFLRAALRRLVVISQVTCSELDNARLNMLAEIQRSNQAQVSIHDLEEGKTYYSYESKRKEYVPFVCEKKYTGNDPEWEKLARTRIVKVPPQSMIVIGGGPTGLTTAIHCTEAVLMSGGVMKLYEARDAFAKGGSTFERAQIVRLDARWIAMLRYHLGTGFEDVYIPASGETDSQLGNTLPTQGFVEITIKDLENMLHVECSKMWSKGLLQVYTNSTSMYDPKTNSLAKLGEYLKKDDCILRRVNEEGRKCNEYHSWKIADIQYSDSLRVEDLAIGKHYGIYVRSEDAVLPYRLTGIDLRAQIYTFSSLKEGPQEIKAKAQSMPYVYPIGTTKHSEASKLILESVKKGARGGYAREIMFMKDIQKKQFTLDVGHTHVVEAIGKPHGSKVHFTVTTAEPYGVCCIQGLKISMGMHNFGEKRWGVGILDDIRSQTDQNTRIVGDFTKMIRTAPVVQKMYEYMSSKKDMNWQTHFERLPLDAGFPELNDLDPPLPKIKRACAELAQASSSFRRTTLQCRFFETGDNYYLGMEFMREYDNWKNKLADDLVLPLALKAKDDQRKKTVAKVKGTLMHHIDRLWYDAALETIRTGDVYNPGARHRVPRLYLISSYNDEKVGKFPVGESFRLSDNPGEKYEIVIKERSQVIVRNVEGYISKLPNSTLVRREGNLTRGPDGNAESKVALATFPVAHYVNHRSCRLNDSEKGYLFAFIGDEQATPHFMRYSGLTGACINAMLFNNFIKQAMDCVPFIDRLRLYSMETNWSNGEVVQRGTGANYGEDGFLRPGFSYDHVMDYLHSKVIEYRESRQDLNKIVSRDWKVKLAASLVPRGMELNKEFNKALHENLRQCVFRKFVHEVKSDEAIADEAIERTLVARDQDLANQSHVIDYESYWNEFLVGLNVDAATGMLLQDSHVPVAMRLDQICHQVIDFATKSYLFNERISSELENQPKSVDFLIDNFSVQAQDFANSLTMSSAFAAGALAFTLAGESVANIFGAVLAGLNILLAFGTMTNSARYKIRNEESRIIFTDEKMLGVLKGVFRMMDRMQQDSIPTKDNPFVMDLEQKVSTFLKNVQYYDLNEPKHFEMFYQQFLSNDIHDPKEIRYFQKVLAARYIADEYHVNSYVQESLVAIYKTLEEMHVASTTSPEEANLDAERLFRRLVDFRGRLEHSLQRGATRFGFLKKRRLLHWDCTVAFKYFFGTLCCCVGRFDKTLCMARTSTQTLGIIKQARLASGSPSQQSLSREIRDLESLYWATNESDVASLIFVTGFLVFVTSIVFTIARIFRIQVLLDIAFWASLASALGAILASFHLWRKFCILIQLATTLRKKWNDAQSSEDRLNIKKVQKVTWTQIALTAARFLSAAGAAVALPWSVAENAFGDSFDTWADAPFWIALGAVAAAIGATAFFFIVEYQVRYSLSPKLGEFVCESFRDEIETLKTKMSVPMNDMDTKVVQERETWEYVAREFLHQYRFDTVFAADRFGNILQYIQGGMDPRE